MAAIFSNSFDAMREINELRIQISLIKRKFQKKHNNVDEFVFYSFHEELRAFQTKISIIREDYHRRLKKEGDFDERNKKQLKNALHQLGVVELELNASVALMKLKDPIRHFRDAVEAIESDLETNFCWLRRIQSNLPYTKNWMHFLTGLTDQELNASFNYYKVSLKEVHLRSQCITSIRGLLQVLDKESSLQEHLSVTTKRLVDSNASCEKLCHGVWLRLLDLIVYIEKCLPMNAISSNIITTTTISASEGLQNCRKEDISPKRVRDDPCCLSLKKDRRLIRKTMEACVPCVSSASLRKSFSRSPVLASTCRAQMSNGMEIDNQPEATDDAHAAMVTNNRFNMDGNSEASHSRTYGSLDRHCLKQRKCLLNKNSRSYSGGLNISSSNGVQCSRVIPRSLASIFHSEARKIIAQLPTGSEITSTSSRDAVLCDAVEVTSSSGRQRFDAYLTTAAGLNVAPQHSNSNVDVHAMRRRPENSSDDNLFMARARSLCDLHGSKAAGTIGVSHSLEDTTILPHELSEHLTAFWDNYQVPYYSSLEAVGPLEPKAQLPDNLLWTDFLPDETEALDLERFKYPQQSGNVKGGQLDEWSFDGLSTTPLSFMDTEDLFMEKEIESQSSDALLELVDEDPFSEDDAPPPRGSRRKEIQTIDKCLQTEFDNDHSTKTPNACPPVTNSNQSLSMHLPDLTTTHTSGYESGPDVVDYYTQRNSLCSTSDFNEICPKCPASTTTLLPRNSGALNGRLIASSRCKTPSAINEEPSESSPTTLLKDVNLIAQSEQNLVKLREFLHEILDCVAGSSLNQSPKNTLVSKRSKLTHPTSQMEAPASPSSMMKKFNLILESAEKNIELLRRINSSQAMCSPQGDTISSRWCEWSKWVHSHTLELQELSHRHNQLNDLAARLAVLSQISDQMFPPSGKLMSTTRSLNLQTLSSESYRLLDDVENIRDLLIKQRLQNMNRSQSIDPTNDELSQMEDLFVRNLDCYLDRAISEASVLAEKATGTKATFAYQESLNDWFQASTPINRDTTGSIELDSSQQTLKHCPHFDTNRSFSGPSKCSSTPESHLKSNQSTTVKQIYLNTPVYHLLPLLLVVFIFCLLFSYSLSHAPIRCSSGAWSGWQSISTSHNFGVPPH